MSDIQCSTCGADIAVADAEESVVRAAVANHDPRRAVADVGVAGRLVSDGEGAGGPMSRATAVCRYCGESVHASDPDDLPDAMREHWKFDCPLHPRYSGAPKGVA